VIPVYKGGGLCDVDKTPHAVRGVPTSSFHTKMFPIVKDVKGKF
jgi:hypothetical protein